MFSRTDLNSLIEAAPAIAVSIYMPTLTHGRETRQNPIMLKNLLAQARDRLAALGLAEPEAGALLEPAARLVEDHEFWQHQDLGLALFLSEEGLQIFKLPVTVPERVIAGAGFHIAPLLPLQELDAAFVILTITADAAGVWQATRFAIEATAVADLPASIESLDEAPDYEGPLQSHGFGRPNTGGQSMPKTQVYGDSPEEWRKGRLVEFARRVGSALAAHLASDPQRVVVVADATIGGHVRNDDALATLVAGFVEVNPTSLDPAGLLAAALTVMQPLHEQARDASLERLGAGIGRGDAASCTDPAGLIAAAREGRVEELFMVQDAMLWGVFDPATGSARVAKEADAGALDLLDKAAQMTLGNGGGVHVVAQDRLPDGIMMAATLRY